MKFISCGGVKSHHPIIVSMSLEGSLFDIVQRMGRVVRGGGVPGVGGGPGGYEGYRCRDLYGGVDWEVEGFPCLGVGVVTWASCVGYDDVYG